jgi:hypothetical protein
MNKNIDDVYNELLFEYKHGGIKSATVNSLGLTKSQRMGLLTLILAESPTCDTACEVSHSL